MLGISVVDLLLDKTEAALIIVFASAKQSKGQVPGQMFDNERKEEFLHSQDLRAKTRQGNFAGHNKENLTKPDHLMATGVSKHPLSCFLPWFDPSLSLPPQATHARHVRHRRSLVQLLHEISKGVVHTTKILKVSVMSSHLLEHIQL